MNNAILQRFDLDGRTVVITGGGGALCGAMADALGTMGAKVAVLDISLESARVSAFSRPVSYTHLTLPTIYSV